MNTTVAEHLPILPLLLTLSGALLAPIVGLVSRLGAFLVTIGACVAASGAAAAGLRDVIQHGTRRYELGGWEPPWGIELVLDPFSAFTATVVVSVSTLTLATSGRTTLRRVGHGTPVFYALTLIALTGFLGIIASGDLFNVFVFLEITAISSYALIASGGGPALAAAYRYLVVGTVGASLYLLGVSLLYALTGSLNEADLLARLPGLETSPLFAGGVALTVVGLAIKMGLFPLHAWLPDAYTHAPSPVSAFLAAVATKAPAFALARTLLYILRPREIPMTEILAWAGAIAILAGSVMAVRQLDARRLLAYSSVSQMGYIALGLGIDNEPALAGAYLHILNHAMMKAVLFIGVGIMLTHGRGPRLATLDLGRTAPVTAACMVVAALSMIGIPPAGGFFSKWYLLQGALEARQPAFVIAILAGSLLAVVYMYRLTEGAWGIGSSHAGDADNAPTRPEAPWVALVALTLLTGAIVLVGVGNNAIVEHVLIPAAAGAL